MTYEDFLKYPIKELKRIYRSLPNTKLGKDLKDEIKKAIDYHKFPNVFLLGSAGPSKRLSYKNIDKGFSTIDYLATYLVKNKNGLRRLSYLFKTKIKVYEYPTIVDIYLSDRTGLTTYEVLGSKDGHIVNNKFMFVNAYYNLHGKRDVRLEVNNNDKFNIIGYLKDYVTSYNVFNKPIKVLKHFLILEKTINDVDYKFILDDNLVLKPFGNNEEYIKSKLGIIILYNSTLLENYKVKYEEFKYKNMRYENEGCREVIKEFKESVNLNRR